MMITRGFFRGIDRARNRVFVVQKSTRAVRFNHVESPSTHENTCPCPPTTHIKSPPQVGAKETHIKTIFDSWNVSNPVESAETLPASFYTDPQIYEAEKRTVFGSNWLYAGHVTELKHEGDYITGTYAQKPYIVVRAEDGQLRAFYNICRHHAMTVTQAPAGNTTEFVCNYHGWKYALNGRLKAAVGVKGIRDFAASKVSLYPIKMKQVGPMIFLHFGGQDEDSSHVESGHEELRDTNYEKLSFVVRKDYKLNCNWKVFVDNYLDGGMHVKYAHPDLASNLDLSTYTTETRHKYSVQKAAASSSDRVSGTAHYVYLYPNFMINRYGDWMDTNLVIPTGVNECIVRMDYYLTDEKLKEKDWIEKSLASSHKVQEEDVWLCEGVQVGLESGVYNVGRYAPSFEKGMHDFHKTLYTEISQ